MLEKAASKLTEKEWAVVGPRAGYLAFVLVAGLLSLMATLLYLYLVGTPILMVVYMIATAAAAVNPVFALVFVLLTFVITCVVAWMFSGYMVEWALNLGFEWICKDAPTARAKLVRNEQD